MSWSDMAGPRRLGCALAFAGAGRVGEGLNPPREGGPLRQRSASRPGNEENRRARGYGSYSGRPEGLSPPHSRRGDRHADRCSAARQTRPGRRLRARVPCPEGPHRRRTRLHRRPDQPPPTKSAPGGARWEEPFARPRLGPRGGLPHRGPRRRAAGGSVDARQPGRASPRLGRGLIAAGLRSPRAPRRRAHARPPRRPHVPAGDDQR